MKSKQLTCAIQTQQPTHIQVQIADPCTALGYPLNVHVIWWVMNEDVLFLCCNVCQIFTNLLSLYIMLLNFASLN